MTAVQWGTAPWGSRWVALAHENLLRDPVLWLVSNWVKLYLQNSVFLFTLSLTKLRSSCNQLRALVNKETVSVLHLCICWKFVVCSLNAKSSALTSLVTCSHPLSVSSLHNLYLFSQTQGGGRWSKKIFNAHFPIGHRVGGLGRLGTFPYLYIFQDFPKLNKIPQMQMLRLPSSIDEWAKIIRDNWDQ